MIPKGNGFNQSGTASCCCARTLWLFQAGLPWQGMTKLYKGSIFCHHGDTICHPKSGYLTTKLHGTSTCGCNNNAMFSGRAISRFLPSSYVGHVNLAREKPSGLMLNCKYGSPVEIIVILVQYFFAASLPYQILWYCKMVEWDIM